VLSEPRCSKDEQPSLPRPQIVRSSLHPLLAECLPAPFHSPPSIKLQECAPTTSSALSLNPTTVRLPSPVPVRIEHHWRRLYPSVQQPTEPAPQFSRHSQVSFPAVLIEVSQQVSKTCLQLRLLLTPKDGCPLPTIPTAPAPKCHCVVSKFRSSHFHREIAPIRCASHLPAPPMHEIFGSAHPSPACAHSISHCGAIATTSIAKMKRHGRRLPSTMPSLFFTAMLALVRLRAQ
jgi:hypothetical protein